MKQKNVEIKVYKVAIKDWLDDASQPVGHVVKKMLEEDGFWTIRSIALKNEVYLIQFWADIYLKERKGYGSFERFLLTDLKSIEDISILLKLTELIGCRIELVTKYSDKLNDIITYYLLGDGWDHSIPVRKDLLDLSKKWSSIIGSARLAYADAFRWENQANQYPESGVGIQYFKGIIDNDILVDCLLFYGEDKTLQGILNYYPSDFKNQRKGEVNIQVREDKRRSGIATSLLDEARLIFEIYLEDQQCTPLGEKFLAEYVKRINNQKF